MKKLSASLLFVTLALVVLNIGTLRELSRVDRHVAALEHDVAALKTSKPYGLGEAMALNQRWFDKLGRAAAVQNWELANFYADELKENVEDMIAAKIVNDGQDISGLLKSTLLPVLQELKNSVGSGDSAGFTTHYTALVNTCNACHTTTKRAFITIALPPGQSFWPQEFHAKR